jgi:uncharacterized membrane protein
MRLWKSAQWATFFYFAYFWHAIDPTTPMTAAAILAFATTVAIFYPLLYAELLLRRWLGRHKSRRHHGIDQGGAL